MKLEIEAWLDYQCDHPTDILLQIEASALPGQAIEHASIGFSPVENFTRIPAQDGVGERIWMSAQGQFIVDYRATLVIDRQASDWRNLPRVAPHRLPGEAVQYLMGSRYCASDQFHGFVDAEFGGLDGGARVIALRDWVRQHFSYVPGSSNGETTAVESFVKRQGICRDYAHIMIALVRACGIPARMASGYAPGVTPQDFHAVAEVYLGDGWHLVDATGMADETTIAVIGIGRDAADVAFLTAYGVTLLNSQSVMVRQVG